MHDQPTSQATSLLITNQTLDLICMLYIYIYILLPTWHPSGEMRKILPGWLGTRYSQLKRFCASRCLLPNLRPGRCVSGESKERHSFFEGPGSKATCKKEYSKLRKSGSWSSFWSAIEHIGWNPFRVTKQLLNHKGNKWPGTCHKRSFVFGRAKLRWT